MTLPIYMPGAKNPFPEIKHGDHVRSVRHGGVAFWYLRPCENHDDCHLLQMVGDDFVWHVDVAEITPLDDDEFCGGCGQIGCGYG